MFDREAYLDALYYDLFEARAQTDAQTDQSRRLGGLAIERRIRLEIDQVMRHCV